jgi:hypothetical protein
MFGVELAFAAGVIIVSLGFGKAFADIGDDASKEAAEKAEAQAKRDLEAKKISSRKQA